MGATLKTNELHSKVYVDSFKDHTHQPDFEAVQKCKMMGAIEKKAVES